MNVTPAVGFRPGLRSTTALLLALLLAINAIAIGMVITSRGRAKAAAAHELARRVEARAERLTALLAATRGDLLFLAQSGSLRRMLDSLEDPDPYRQRWGRLDAEAAGLLFLRAHPEIERLVAEAPDGEALITVGRRGGAPIALPASPGARPRRSPLPPESGALEVRLLVELVPDRLLDGVRSDAEAAFELRDGTRGASDDGAVTGPGVVSAVVEDPAWDPPVRWTLVSRETESDLLTSVDHLASDFRNTLILNVALVSLASVLGWMAIREVRAVERLEAERRHLAKVRDLELGLMHRDRLASLGRIAAGIAHEINNPLEGMQNYVRLLEDDVSEGDTEAARKHMAGVREGLERVAGIVRQTLGQAGEGRGAKEVIDLAAVARRTVDFAKDDPKVAAVHVRVVASAPVAVVGNGTTLGQLVLNLVRNACEARDHGAVEVHVRAHGDRAELAVEDRGPGLAAEDVKRVFEPFFSTKASSGLGLFLCSAIAADHCGTLSAQNRDGGGARFVLEMPLAEKG